MSSLVFTLMGPLQSWGASSRFATRRTEKMPTKSGVIGMLAAAKGLRRTEPLTELLDLRFGVRVEQAGKLLRDFQTERTLDGKASMPLSYRYYLSDAVFLAAVESSNSGLLEELSEALRNPVFPLYLGRRSCPPSVPFQPDIIDESLEISLSKEPWRASEWYRKKTKSRKVLLDMTFDAGPGETGTDTVRDVPVSFDPRRREYTWRDVVNVTVSVDNPDYHGDEPPGHEPMTALPEGA